MPAQIVRVAKYRPLPGAMDDLRAALHALASGMQGMSGLHFAQVCKVDEHPEWLALVSRWEDERSMQGTGAPGIEALVDHVASVAEEQRIEHFFTE